MNVRDEAGRVLHRRQVSTRGTAVREFLAALPLHDRAGGGDGGYAAIVEVCGFNDWLLDLLPQCGCRRIVLVQPREASRWDDTAIKQDPIE